MTLVGSTTLPSMCTKVIQQVLVVLSGLAGTRDTFTMLIFLVLSAYPSATMGSRVYEALGTNVILRPILVPIMTGNEHELLTKFLKMKLPFFQGSQLEYIFEFIIDFYERLHKLGIVQKHRIKLVTFLLKTMQHSSREPRQSVGHWYYLI